MREGELWGKGVDQLDVINSCFSGKEKNIGREGVSPAITFVELPKMDWIMMRQGEKKELTIRKRGG